MSELMEYSYLEDLRQGGQVIGGELSCILYGKKRPLMREYIDLARANKWEAAYEKWQALALVREFYEDIFLWKIARTATYASALASLKVWYEVIGLKAGPMLPPVQDLPRDRAEWVAGRLKELGVS